MVALVLTFSVAAGCSASDEGGARTSTTDAAAGDGSGVLITSGDIYYAAADQRSDETDLVFRASAGEVVIHITNEGVLPHNVVVEEAGDATVVEASGGASETGSVDLDRGTYTLYCDIVGHREAGMEATLDVE